MDWLFDSCLPSWVWLAGCMNSVICLVELVTSTYLLLGLLLQVFLLCEANKFQGFANIALVITTRAKGRIYNP
jgi:hypothetical protein